MRTKKRILSMLLTVCLIASMLPQTAFATGGGGDHRNSGLCEHQAAHDETCGYMEGTEEMPCTHEHTEDCSEKITSCTHTHTADCYPVMDSGACLAYAAPENPECFCGEKCTEDNVNIWCDVCGVQGAEACTAEGEAVMYADVEAKWGTSASDLTNSGTFAEAIAASPAYIQLQSDVSASYLTISVTTTLDLNNCTITGNGSQRIFGVDGGNLTLTDTSGTQGGKITGAGGDAAVVIFSEGQFTMEAGSITGNTKGGVRIYKGTFTMTGGSITGNTSAGSGGGVLNQNSTFIMNGGSITNNNGLYGGGIYSGGDSFDGPATLELSGTVDISGNTASRGSDIYLSQDPVNITGELSIQSPVYVYMGNTSDYKFATATGDVALTETHKNYFTSDHPDYPVVSLDSENNALCLISCDHANVSDNTCSACNSKMVATLKIGGTTTYHHSLKTAFNVAASTTSDNAGTITLLDNVNGTGNITMTSGAVTLDLNSKTISNASLLIQNGSILTLKNGTINSNSTGSTAGIYVQNGSVTLNNVKIEGDTDYDIYIAGDYPIIIQSIPDGEVYTVNTGSNYNGRVFAKPVDGVEALSKKNWKSLAPGGLITENTNGSLSFAACDHSGSTHTTHKDTWGNLHSFTCTVCNGTAYEDHYGGNPTCSTAATCSFCQYSYTVDHQYAYSATENVITETCIYNCEHSETVTIEAPTEIFVYDGTAKEGATVSYSNSENWQGESNLTPTYENNINAGTATASISVDGVTASVTFVIEKANASVSAAPAVKAGLAYTGNPQELITAGEAAGGEMQYSLDGTTYSADIPMGTAAQEYTVYYKVVGGSNHKDTTAQTITVSISKGTAPAITEPTAANIEYGQTLSASTLSDTSWKWTDGTAIPTVGGSGYEAYVSVDDTNYDYMGITGYDSTAHTVKRTIAITVSQATPAITVQATPASAIAGKTIQVSATVKNPNNESLSDLPMPTYTYKIGDSGTEQTFTGSFDIPAGTATGTTITITATTAADNNYLAATDTATVIVTDCTHTGNKTLKYDTASHWYICGECQAEVDKAAHSSGTATCEDAAACSVCKWSYGSALGHDWGDWVSTDTQHSRTCKNDSGHTETVNHTPGDAATCTTPQICTDCGHEIASVTAHSYGAWQSNGDGTHTRTCSGNSDHKETVSCSGGTATCKSPAACTDCGQAYGGTNSSNHTGGTEVRGKADATATAEGYTGDTYCLGCNTKIATGTEIPPLEWEGKPWIFTDVEEIPGHWKYENIKYVYYNDLMGAVGASTLFQPDHPLTRAMFATVLYRMAGSPDTAYTDRFSDVPEGKWYSNAILWANGKGIVQGYSSGSYGINDNITREQIAKMLCLYGEVQGYDVSGRAALGDFTDEAAVSGWAAEFMQWAVDATMITGKPNGDGSFRLDPKGQATRAECAKMLAMFLQKYQ